MNLESRIAELEDELRETQARLRDREGMLHALSEHANDLTYILDRDTRFTYVSPSICNLTEYEAEEIMAADPGGIFHVDDLPIILTAIEEALKSPGEAVAIPDHRIRHRDLRWLYFEGSAVSMPDVPGVNGVVFNCHNITERKHQEETIYRQANYDPLTKLPNRLMFADRLTTALMRGAREKNCVGLLFIDLDGFKKVNDTLGHGAGDELLKVVAQRLSDCVRQDDTISRLGGDEFTVILPNIHGPGAAEIVAKKILERVSEVITLGENEVYISGSIGITIFPDDAEDEETLIQHADTAMYEAKSAGRRTYKFFTSQMNRAAIEKLELETELRTAIEREEFDIRFQPIIDLASGAITGAEALVRWNHPKRGLTSPDVFISLAEEQGLIVAIGEWVIRAACAEVGRWREAGFGQLRMAINVSPRQCQEPSFDTRVAEILDEMDIPAGSITLEITESLFIEGAHEDAVAALHNCRNKGSHLSLDDFGTGYSSLSYLKRFPVDVLKIDRAFVNDIVTSAEDRALCQGIVAMAHAFNVKVVGEGVETEDHAAVLRELACDRAQGYLIAKPLSSDEFSAFLSSWDGVPA
ncbi:MAG: EAL domain-containing protein [Magnetovibrio sp.]|nr:EAL domain-containing protein [Magnetovibrio sp.]